MFGCQLKSGAVPANENFAFNPSSGQIHSFINADSCLVASAGHTGGIVYTTDELGEDWCIACGSDSTECDSRPGSVAAVPCMPSCIPSISCMYREMRSASSAQNLSASRSI